VEEAGSGIAGLEQTANELENYFNDYFAGE
jgi:hypothetical protein